MPLNTPIKSRYIAIAGNPNCGKTTLFNALTGLRHKVGNYPGVTVEKKEGKVRGTSGDITLLDLPGTYSLLPRSPDEAITRDVLLGKQADTALPEMVVCVADASNLERNLYLVSQVIDLGLPVVLALNMVDVAEQEGHHIDPAALSNGLGIPVISTVANRKEGAEALRQFLDAGVWPQASERRWQASDEIEEQIAALAALIEKKDKATPHDAFFEAISMLSTIGEPGPQPRDPELRKALDDATASFERKNIDIADLVDARYAWLAQVVDNAMHHDHGPEISLSDRLDSVLTHKIWGLVIFLVLMGIVFQSIFTWAQYPMDLIGGGFNTLGQTVARVLPAGDLKDLIINGVIGGAGNVVMFLPQIMLLFLFIGLLEDTGYMARAAFIMDRLMSKVGLHGRSFIPMLSSFACAIPGIMATRTIESRKDRLVTILVAPLMSCSARLPVYTLLIGAFIPRHTILGFWNQQGATLLGLYLLGIVAALGMAALFKKTLLKSETPLFLMELPPYRVPSVPAIAAHLWERASLFLKRAGTVILAISILLWFVCTYPKHPNLDASEQLRHSFAGSVGHVIEPAIRPLGFNWKIGIGLVASVLQREVFVTAMGTVFNIENSTADRAGEMSVTLKQKMREDRDAATGKSSITPLVALALLVYYVLAMQCMSTLAVVRRETNSWKWPAFQFVYMTVLAWVVTFGVYQGGRLLGYE